MRILGKFFQLMIGATAVSMMLALAAHLILRQTADASAVWWVGFLNIFTPYYFLPLLALLPLALLARLSRKWVVLPLALFVLVGLVWFAPRWIPDGWFAPQSAQASGATLQLVTYNMRGRSRYFNIAREVFWLRDTPLDLAFIQEIPRMYHLPVRGVLVEKFPFQMNHTAQTRLRGQSILSRFPVVSRESFTLIDGGEAQMRLVIDLNGRHVALYNIHLLLPIGAEVRFPVVTDNETLALWASYDEQWRNREIAALIERIAAEPLPYIVAGDFNTSDNAVIYDSLAAHMTDAFRARGSGIGGTWPVAVTIGLPAFVPEVLRIDYIWHSHHFRALDARVGAPVSDYGDHLPVYATLELLAN